MPEEQEVMVQPINLISQFLQSRSRVYLWLNGDVSMRIEGYIVGFDNFMNVVLDEAEEHYMETDERMKIGRILLNGKNITLIQNTNPEPMALA